MGSVRPPGGCRHYGPIATPRSSRSWISTTLAGIARMDSIRLLVPILVVDELDRLKERGTSTRAGGRATRWQSFDELFERDLLQKPEYAGTNGAVEDRGEVGR